MQSNAERNVFFRELFVFFVFFGGAVAATIGFFALVAIGIAQFL